jgi:DNA-binding NtrC family response regulator
MPGRAAVTGPSSTDDQAAETAWPTLADVERIHLERTLAATMQNKSLAAKLLGIDRSVLRRKLQRYGMEGQPGEEPAGPDSASP